MERKKVCPMMRFPPCNAKEITNVDALQVQVIVFLIVALAVFMFVVKPMNMLNRKKEAPAPAPDVMSKDQNSFSKFKECVMMIG